jgi:hypothetical protein
VRTPATFIQRLFAIAINLQKISESGSAEHVAAPDPFRVTIRFPTENSLTIRQFKATGKFGRSLPAALPGWPAQPTKTVLSACFLQVTYGFLWVGARALGIAPATDHGLSG